MHKQLSTANVAVGTFVGNVASMFARMAISGAGGLFEGTVKSASNLNESISKTKAIYGDAAGTIIANAQQMATTFGLSKQEMLDASGIFGLMAKGAGSSGEAAAQFGNKMTKLAADAMSFYNVPMDVALEKIRSGLSGESEPLRAFGVFLSEAAVANEAMAMGLAKNANNLTDGQKIMARASLITKGLADANGDLERTFSGTENQTRKFWGTLSNLGQDIGGVLLPAFDSLLSVATSTLTGISAGWENNKGAFRGFVDSITGGIQVVTILWSNWSDASEITSLKIGEGLANIQAVFTAVGANIVNIAKYIGDNWYNLLVDALNATATAFTNFGANLGNLASAAVAMAKNPLAGFNFEWKPLLDGFEATAGALPDLVKPAFMSVQDQVDEITTRMGDKAAARATTAVSQAANVEKKIAAGGDATTKEKAGSITGAAEFASKLRLAQGGGDVGEKQLTELQALRKQEAESTKQLVDAFNTGRVAVLG